MGREGCTGKEVKRLYFSIIDNLQHRFPVPWLCSLYGVSKSGYYRWKKAPSTPNRYERVHNEIDALAAEIHRKHPSYGYMSINAVMLMQTGWKLCDYSLMKSMQRLGIRSRARKKRTIPIGSEHIVFPNILSRNFHPLKPMQHVAVDICQFRNNSQKYCFIAYLDMFNNEILSWNLRKREDMSLVLPPLRQLLSFKDSQEPLLIHSDQGSQFASYSYSKLLQEHRVTQSMSRAGTPRDNAVIESFIGWFKDMLYLDFNIHKASDVFTAVEHAVHYFNHSRPAFALNYKTPVQFKAAQGF